MSSCSPINLRASVMAPTTSKSFEADFNDIIQLSISSLLLSNRYEVIISRLDFYIDCSYDLRLVI